MPKQVVAGAIMQCTCGVSPSVLNVLPVNRVLAPTPAANINDHIPLVNIPPFGLCTTTNYPPTDTATKAAGVLVPMPCVPSTPAPWLIGAPTVLIGSIPALDDISKLNCIWSGVISITQPGQLQMDIP